MSNPINTSRKGKTFRELVNEAKDRIQQIDIPTLKQWQAEGKSVVVLDIREREDFANGHIPESFNVPRGELELDIDEVVPDQNQVIVTYCGGGSRSALAADTLQVMGYDHVYSLAGGWKGWKQA